MNGIDVSDVHDTQLVMDNDMVAHRIKLSKNMILRLLEIDFLPTNPSDKISVLEEYRLSQNAKEDDKRTHSLVA